MDQTLGKRISAHRKQLGLTQDQLAEKLGVTAQAVSKWENDQSCPDISMLPKLAEIFGTSIDELLGREPQQTVHTATIVSEEDDDSYNDDQNTWEFKFDNSRRWGISFASFIILTGCLWLVSNFLELGVSLWNIAIPSALLVFGGFGLYPKFSFLRLGSLLLGGYFLLSNFSLLPFDLNGKDLLLPAFLVIFGLSLLMDALRKPKKPKCSFKADSAKKRTGHHDFEIDGDHLEFSASFGDQNQLITMERLHRGSIETSFGDYTLDFSGVESITSNCRLEVDTSFGDLTLLIPRRYLVVSENTDSFGSIEIDGTPDGTDGTIYMEADCSFGQITVRYI
jgi:transcriptional regulator with XRE-family HTH domain